MLKSPFPGMDRYLERFWPEVHARLIVYAANQINRQLPDELRTHIEGTLTVDEEEEERRSIRPDVNRYERFSDVAQAADSRAIVSRWLSMKAVTSV